MLAARDFHLPGSISVALYWVPETNNEAEKLDLLKHTVHLEFKYKNSLPIFQLLNTLLPLQRPSS